MMSAYDAASRIQLASMPQLAEAVDREDDWTGVTDAASRRKRQNRLNVRAYRRRKALESKEHPASVSTCRTRVAKSEPEIPCWVEDQQRISLLPASVANALNTIGSPLIPYKPATPNDLARFERPPVMRIVFPLAPDHLITLLQFNVLRASIANRRLLSPIETIPTDECSSAALHILPDLPSPEVIPPSLHPTFLQKTIPHEAWIDIIPHPVWRDNVILAVGTFDEDELWSDTIGGLFEGFPDSEIQQRGVIAWSPPWHISGWEISEGFWRKWKWSFKGCEDVLEATNAWRKRRGEEPLLFEI